MLWVGLGCVGWSDVVVCTLCGFGVVPCLLWVVWVCLVCCVVLCLGACVRVTYLLYELS